MDPALLAGGYAYVLAAGLAVARMSGIIMVAPFFTRLGVSGIVRGGIALALALPVLPAIAAALTVHSFTPVTLAALALKEIAVGLVIGLVLGAPFWAAETAGDVLDLQRGANSASLVDPLASTEEGISGTLFGLAMVALFYASGGLSLATRTIYDSYGLWPAGRFLPLFGAGAGVIILGLLDKIVTMGVVLAAPLMLCLLLADLLIALLSRTAPSFNLFALSLGVKNLAFAVLVVLYCAFLISYMGGDLGSLLAAGSELEQLRAPQGP